MAGIGKDDIEEGIRNRYRVLAARGTGGLFGYPTGEEGLRKLGYPHHILSALPEEVKAYFCGVGNPIKEVNLHEGVRLLDVGCGAGVDAIIAARIVGPECEVVGVDLVEEMVALATAQAVRAGTPRVSFLHAPGDELPFPDGYFHALISNGVFNLLFEKEKALGEWRRVLKPGGEAVIADMSLEDGVTTDDVKGRGAWSD